MSYQFTNVSGSTQTQHVPGYNNDVWAVGESRSIPDGLLPFFRSCVGVFSESAGGGGGGITPVAFNTTIPLGANSAMAASYIGSATAFTPGASPINGASCSVVLYSDGVTLPTFPGFLQAASSSGFDASAVGKVNYVDFWYDGRSAWYAVTQPNPNTPDLTFPGIIPVLSAVATSRDGAKLFLTYNLGLVSNSPALGSFTLSDGKTITASSTSGTTVSLTLSAPYALGDTPTLSYTPGSPAITASANSALAAAFSGVAITNLAGTTTPLRFTPSGSVTESANTPITGQYTYNINAGGSFGTNIAISPRSVPASTAGLISMDVVSAAQQTNIIFGVKASNSAGTFTGWIGSLSCNGTKYVTTIGASAGVVSAFNVTAGDIMQIRITAAGQVIAEFATAANPSVFTPIATLATNTAQKWAVFDSNSNGTKCVNPQASPSFV